MNRYPIIIVIFFIIYLVFSFSLSQNNNLGKIILSEPDGLVREVEYVEFPIQLPLKNEDLQNKNLIAIDSASQEKIYCQVISEKNFPEKNMTAARVVFPVSMAAHSTKTFFLKIEREVEAPVTDLRIEGEGLDLIIQNKYYQADLSRRAEPEPKIHNSGQIQELLIKLGYNQLLTNAEDRIHWAPNFKREEIEWYTTIAHWENPKEYRLDSGEYLIRTVRRDAAPEHPEIMLSAVYKFYAGVPFFRFYSEMEFTSDLPLELLRNDEMTTDSMFTHLAFQRPDGEVATMTFKERFPILNENPIEANAPWICFYNVEHGFAFGSIRLKYDNHGYLGDLSPTYQAHTQIGEWLDRKYWNRRLIHDHMIGVPAGSRYMEENAYLVFSIGEADRFENIKYWAERLRNPVNVFVYPRMGE
ncbi:MAG: hypothetical protein JSW33_02205 [bacterium]|nr:MAG: hypothetical protein JSW33_02205 [bacterium]